MHIGRHLGFLGSTILILLCLGLSQAQKDCTGVDCEPLENCIEEVLESDACCASCLQRGCTCEGYQYYDCVNVGFRHGKVPEGQSYFVDFGSTECSCPKGGGKISCQFIACQELPANCIEVLQPADGCPQCGSLGCVQGDQKYVEGHTFQMPGCKVCHCPKYGGELMCYAMPGCDASKLNPQSKPEHEDVEEAERHYDDPYSYDQDAPDRDSARLETSKRHRSSLTSVSVENSMEQDEDYDQSEKNRPFPKFSQPTPPGHGSNISYPSAPSTPSYFTEDDMNEITTTETPEIEDANEPTTPADSAYKLVETIISTTQESVVPDTIPEHTEEDTDQANDKEDTTKPNEDNSRQEETGKEDSRPATTEMPTLPPQSKQEDSNEDHEESPLPRVRFVQTDTPPISLKDHSEVAERQSQTLYHYARDDDDDPNSISLESRLQEGSTKEIVETCCAAGQQWAIDNGECVDIFSSETDNAACKIAQNHCCVSYIKENSCVAGMIAAKEGDFCVTDETDTCGGSFYKQCCDCCTLGLKVKSEGHTCDSNPNLGYPCNQVMLSCCEGEDQLMPPEIKKQPEPAPTVKPQKVSEPLEHNEAFSVDNEAGVGKLLVGYDVDECLLYPGELCHHLCIDTERSYKCDCFPGFTMQEDGSSCKPDNENFDENSVLLQHTTAPELLKENSLELVTVAAPRVQEDKCKDNGPCKHMCNIVQDNVVCSCSPGYTLMVDGVSCEDLDECLSGVHSCSRGELCENTLGSFHCVYVREMCAAGFIFNNNDRQCVDINECVAEKHTCLRGEHCINTAGSFTCLKEVICQSGFENKDDICVDIDECERGTHDCKVGFSCQNSKGAFYCESRQRCRDGFIQDPAGNCVDVNECTSLPEPCKVGFICINTVGSYTCQRAQLMCSRGYHASEDGSRCIDVDECQTGVHRCGETQVCHNLPGTHHCDCKRGYQADAFSRTCIDINECWNYPGQLCQHTCENTQGSYHCSCSSGFRLAFDGKHCEDVNECENNPCSQECANVYGSYQCYCRQGYQLAEDGHSCKDIDECVQSIGSLCTFRCVNAPGSYQCACPDQGYTIAANGRTCKDIDECAIGSHNCSSSESCYNIQGSYRCLLFMCPENYRKVADMRCERINCLNYLDCQNTPVRITYYQLTFPSNIVVPSHIFRIGPSPAYAGDNIVLTITKGNEENYFSTRKLNQYTGIVFVQRQFKEPKDFLIDVEMKLWRQGTYTTFLARMYVFITEQAMRGAAY